MDGREGGAAPTARPWPDRSRHIHQVLVVFELREEPLVAVHRFFARPRQSPPRVPRSLQSTASAARRRRRRAIKARPMGIITATSMFRRGIRCADLNGPP